MSIRQYLNLASRDGTYFFLAQNTSDGEIAEFLRFLDDYVRQFVDHRHGAVIQAGSAVHRNVVAFLKLVDELAEKGDPRAGEAAATMEFVRHCRSHAEYLRSKCDEFGLPPVADWIDGIAINPEKADAPRVVSDVVYESIDHFYGYVRERSPGLTTDKRLTVDNMDSLFRLLPVSVGGLRTEAELSRIWPWFVTSLDIAGDVCEFGCFQGTMSIKFAFALKALGKAKTVFAFDTFAGFEEADPAGGVLQIGAYEDNGDAFTELTKWSKVIPVQPMKGDARETCKHLKNQLSFVWLDIDFSTLMAPVLRTIWPLIGTDTVIGIDDVGRPETPSVLPWVEQLTNDGILIELARYDGFQRFFRANKLASIG